VSGIIIDFTATHVYNPAWPPHAQFHGYLSIARTALIMLAAIALVWGPVRAGAAYAWSLLSLLLLGWLGIWFVAPLAVPGAGERASYLFAGALLPLVLVGLWLVRPGPRMRAPSS
jgi:hypothetical protein